MPRAITPNIAPTARYSHARNLASLFGLFKAASSWAILFSNLAVFRSSAVVQLKKTSSACTLIDVVLIITSAVNAIVFIFIRKTFHVVIERFHAKIIELVQQLFLLLVL